MNNSNFSDDFKATLDETDTRIVGTIITIEILVCVIPYVFIIWARTLPLGKKIREF